MHATCEAKDVDEKSGQTMKDDPEAPSPTLGQDLIHADTATPIPPTEPSAVAGAQTPIHGEENRRPRRPSRRNVLLAEVILGAIGAGAVAGTGVSGLPVWAVVLFSMGITAAVALATKAAVGPESERVRSLWATVSVLVALFIGTLLYVNLPGRAAFVNYVNDQDVVLSPVAGAGPRTGYDAAVLVAGEEHPAYCYVIVKGETWLFFKGTVQDGWARLSAFHLSPEAHSDLPERC
jgi:hypothetical protein